MCFWVLFLACLVLHLWITLWHWRMSQAPAGQKPFSKLLQNFGTMWLNRHTRCAFVIKFKKKKIGASFSMSNLKTIFSFSIWCLRCSWASLRRARLVLLDSSSGQPSHQSTLVIFLCNPWSVEVGLCYYQAHPKKNGKGFPASLTTPQLCLRISQSCYFHYHLMRNVFLSIRMHLQKTKYIFLHYSSVILTVDICLLLTFRKNCYGY